MSEGRSKFVHPAPYLRSVLESGDTAVLASALMENDFSETLRLSMLKEFPALPWQMRILLLRPEMAEACISGKDFSSGKNFSKEENVNKGETEAEDPMFRLKVRTGAKWPVLREPLALMPFLRDPEMAGYGTDGLRFYGKSKISGRISFEDFQHMLMHCVFGHMDFPERIQKRLKMLKGRPLALWDLAADMAAEYLRTILFPGKDAQEVRLSVTASLPPECDPKDPLSIYTALGDLFEDELEGMYARFAHDDHRYWYRMPGHLSTERAEEAIKRAGSAFSGAIAEGENRSPEEQAAVSLARVSPGERSDFPSDGTDPENWRGWLSKKVREHWFSAEEEMASGSGQTRSGKYGLSPGSREEKMILREIGKYDFTRYLRRFSTVREETRINQADFDYIPYYYGLERYGNMPLLEPLEYTESRKVEELVIAIDTSGSCSLPIVQRFFAEIEKILLNGDNFFRKMNIQIIQCDSIIQDHAAIHSQEEWKLYRNNLTIKGRGGTDFNPVFRLVEKLRDKGEIKDLKGLLYFTDGDGAYPRYPTDYETAFVFTTRKALQFKIPEWIVPLCLDMEPAEKAPYFRA